MRRCSFEEGSSPGRTEAGAGFEGYAGKQPICYSFNNIKCFLLSHLSNLFFLFELEVETPVVVEDHRRAQIHQHCLHEPPAGASLSGSEGNPLHESAPQNNGLAHSEASDESEGGSFDPIPEICESRLEELLGVQHGKGEETYPHTHIHSGDKNKANGVIPSRGPVIALDSKLL